MLDLCSPMGYDNNINPLVNWYNNRFFQYSIGPVYNFKGRKSSNTDYRFFWQQPSYGWNFLGPVYNFTGTGGSASVSTVSKASDTKTVKESKPDSKPEEKPVLSTKEFNTALVSNVEKYLGCIEGDKTYEKFSSSPEWCADFVSYVVKETYKEKGLPIPEGFGSHRVEEIKQWSIKNNNFLSTVGKENKAQFIAQNIKPGNLMILRENDASHIGIVTKVNKDGSFETIEGNVSYNGVDSVVRERYGANYADLSGFVRLPV